MLDGVVSWPSEFARRYRARGYWTGENIGAAFARSAAAHADRAPLRELQAWIPDHLDEDLSVPALARRACMSDRNFARAFKAETGLTPAVYVEALRVERARLALESGREPIEAIARRCGFGTVETLRRAFARRLGVSPAAYRDRFAA